MTTPQDPISRLEADMLAAAAADADRELHKFTLPTKTRDKGLQRVLADGLRAIYMVELTVEEELVAARRAGGDPVNLAFELAKESLRAVDVYNADSKKTVRQMVGTGDRSTDQQWKRSPKVRNLMMSAYGAVNNASKDDTEAFIEGCVVVAG